jgi:hypothetical protein
MEKNTAKMQNESLINSTVRRLESDMEMLMKDLQNELKQIKDCREHGVQYKPNTLGIVQGQAFAIDNLCGRLGALLNIKEYLD